MCYLANIAATEETSPSRRVAREVENRMTSRYVMWGAGLRTLKKKVERNQRSDLELSLI